MNHCTETDIQLYALDRAESSLRVQQHIENCDYCMAQVKNYQLIFSTIKEEPKAAFDFDLAALVIPQLPQTKSGVSPDRFIAVFLVIFTCCCVGLPLFIFGEYILNMFSGIPPFFMYATIGSATIILIIKILNMYMKYHRQMQMLNLH